MATNKFDDLLSDLIESDDLSEDIATRIREASAGSPLRKEIGDWKQRAEAAELKAQGFRDGAIKAQFAKHDLKLNPKALALPDDLDVTDDKAVKDWLVEAGAIEDTENAEIDAELDQHDRTAQAAQTGKTARTTGVLTPADIKPWAPDKWMRFEKEHPEAAEELLQGREVRGIAF